MSASAVLLAISRDDAKRLFAQKDEAVLRAFLQAQIEQASGDRVLHLSEHWETLQHAFANAGAGTPLADVLLGGRPLHHANDWQAFLKRPDAVPQIAAALMSFSSDDLSIRLQNGNGDRVLSSINPLFEAIRGFYQAAAANHDAAIFVVQP